MQLRFPTMPGAANVVSLAEAQKNYADFGAAERRHCDQVRPPLSGEEQEHAWRRLDPGRDNPESPRSGIAYGDSYPEQDYTVLYYWRPTYWRRLVS